MQLRNSFAAIVFVGVIALGQPATITVTSSPVVSSQLDQAAYSVSVESGIDVSLDDLVSALAGTGISAGNLSDVSLESQSTNDLGPLSWRFQLTVPFSKVKDTATALVSLQKTLGAHGLTLGFTYEGSLASQSQTCDFGNLMADGRRQAQDIAGASGFTAGAVAGIVGSVTQSTPDCFLNLTFGPPASRSTFNTVTITASRTTIPVVDQVSTTIYVTTETTSGPDDISAALVAAGISGATFTGVDTYSTYDQFGTPQPALEWSFSLISPLAKLTSVLAQMAAAQTSIAKQHPTWSFSIYLTGPIASPQILPACQNSALISDARSLAQTVAAAAGGAAGRILNLESSVSLGSSAGQPGLIYAALLTVPRLGASGCSLSVQFQLVGGY